MSPTKPPVIDALQYCRWTEDVFRQMRAGGVDAVHVTIAYHEDFRETVANIVDWNARFAAFSDLILPGRAAEDVALAQQSGRTAVFFGLQTPAPIEDDIGLVQVLADLGVRFMQLTYNNQSLLAAGCYEAEDAGVSRMGREAIAEMNRVGMVIDMSHSAERSTLEAIEISQRPVAITHANPSAWRDCPRNKSDAVLRALSRSGGMLGFSLYPHHLAGGSECTQEAFCAMVARCAETYGVDMLGIGSDLCQGQPDAVVEWMRHGRWSRAAFAQAPDPAATFPPQPAWFRSNADMPKVAAGLAEVGFSDDEVTKIMGGNWMRFFATSFEATS